MTTYNIEIEGEVLKVGFADPAQNDSFVRDAAARLDKMSESGELSGGSLLKIKASLSLACVLVHKVAHLYGAIGVFDPKLGKYVISITHNPMYKLGDLID
jgi:CRISPR-associated protein Csx3